MRKYFLSAAVFLFCALPGLSANAAGQETDLRVQAAVQAQAEPAAIQLQSVQAQTEPAAIQLQSVQAQAEPAEIRMQSGMAAVQVQAVQALQLEETLCGRVDYLPNIKKKMIGCYQDNDGDGICDYYRQGGCGQSYRDADGDGICDRYENGESGQGWSNKSNNGSGAGARQAGHHGNGAGSGHHSGGRGGHHHGW